MCWKVFLHQSVLLFLHLFLSTNTVKQSFLFVIMDGYYKMIIIMCLPCSVHPQEPSGGPLGPDQRFTDLCGREWTGQCLFFFFLRFVFVLREVLTDGGETSTNRNILHQFVSAVQNNDMKSSHLLSGVGFQTLRLPSMLFSHEIRLSGTVFTLNTSLHSQRVDWNLSFTLT